MRTLSRYSCCNRTKGGGKNVIVMYTCKDNLIPLLYSGKIKKKKERNFKKLKKKINKVATSFLEKKKKSPPHEISFRSYKTDFVPVSVINIMMHLSTKTSFLNIIISISHQSMGSYLLTA